MADFKALRTRCQVHPAVGRPIECTFDAQLADAVYDNLRSFVRVTGEAEEDPTSGRIRLLKIADIEPLEIGTEAASLQADEFWREPSFEELAEEQGVEQQQDLGRLIGGGADLWEDDKRFDAFVAGIYERRRESRAREANGS